MRKLFSVFIFVLLCYSLSIVVSATTNSIAVEAEDDCESSCNIGYCDSDLNIISNIVNGEVGGIVGTVTLTYYDGSVVNTDGCALHKIHAQIVDNQVNSDMFPSTVYGCAKQCWSSAYAKTGERNSSQWKHCKADVIKALTTDDKIPNNVFAATCDSKFDKKYDGYHLYARVQWDTGWTHGIFYYYYYGDIQEDEEENSNNLDIIEQVNNIREYLLSLKSFKDLECIKCLGKNG